MARLRSLELICLGTPAVRVNGEDPPSDVSWRKNIALLVYLALSPERSRTRDHLIGMLWPDKPEKDARHSFNEALRRLRQSLGEERLLSRGDLIQLNDQALMIDALRIWSRPSTLDVVAEYRGDFMEGFTVPDAPPMDDWIAGQRRDMQRRFTQVLLRMAEEYLAACRFDDARRLGERAGAIAPYDEGAARIVMQAAALSHDVSGALAAFRDLKERLAGLDETPTRELNAFAERLRDGAVATAGARERELDPPLVGRAETVREAVNVARESLGSGLRVVLVTGSPGMGRTRLLDECVKRLRLEGAVVGTARPLPGDADTQWTTLRHLLRSGLARAPGLMGASPGAIAVLGSFAPELTSGANAGTTVGVAEVGTALGEALAAAADERPVAIAVDDAHFADRSTLGALHRALTRVPASRVALLLTAAEPQDNPPAELLHLRSEIGRTLPGATVKLRPFTNDELAELTRLLATWCENAEQLDRLTRRLLNETAGSPFYAVTLLRGLERMTSLRKDIVAWPAPFATFDSPLPFSVPDIVGTAVAARLVELTPDARRVLAAATVGGIAFDLPLIAALTELNPAQIEEALAAAERRHLVNFDGERYAFAAPLIGEVVRRECVTAGQRKGLSQRAIEILGSRTDLESRVLRLELSARVGAGREVLPHAVNLAREARSADATRAAGRAVAVAVKIVGDPPAPEDRKLLDTMRGP